MMPKILKASNDYIFKRVFGDERNKDILAEFLMSVLDFPKEEYEGLAILNPHTNIEKIKGKTSILDILVHTRSQQQIHVEIQVKEDKAMRERLMYYASKKLASQLDSGEEHRELKKVVSILITGYSLTGEERYHNIYRVANIKTGAQLTDILEVHTLEYDKLPVEEDGRMLYNWLRIIKSNSMEELQMLKDKSEAIEKAVGILEYLSQDKEARIEYETREKGLRDYNSGIANATREGIEQGVEQNKLEVAKKGLENGIDIQTLVLLTGLTERELGNLLS